LVEDLLTTIERAFAVNSMEIYLCEAEMSLDEV
jgi:hypothetical protein